MSNLTCNADKVMSWGPCENYPEKRVREILGERDWTALEILGLLDIPVEDRLWVVLRSEMIAENDLHELGCRFAESVLPIFEGAFPDDKRPREAIAAKRAWLRGEITDAWLAAAREAAREAEWDAAWDAWDAWDAWAAASLAARVARESTAAETARAAVSASAGAERESQIRIVREFLEYERNVWRSNLLLFDNPCGIPPVLMEDYEL